MNNEISSARTCRVDIEFSVCVQRTRSSTGTGPDVEEEEAPPVEEVEGWPFLWDCDWEREAEEEEGRCCCCEAGGGFWCEPGV